MNIPGRSHIPPNLTLEARQGQLSQKNKLPFFRPVAKFVYDHLDRNDLILVIEILAHDCDKLRRKLDDARGVVR